MTPTTTKVTEIMLKSLRGYSTDVLRAALAEAKAKGKVHTPRWIETILKERGEVV